MLSIPEFLNQRPPVLYHYTNGDALVKIIQNRELWATNVLYLNDAKEFKHGLELLGATVRKIGDQHIQPAYEAAREAVSNGYINVLIVSFSENPDQLSQWRAYGGLNGFSIGFAEPDLRSLLSVSGFRLVKCLYKDSEQSQIINELASYLKRIHDLVPEADHQKLKQMLLDVFTTIAALKDHGFAEEREWRLVGRSEDLRFRPGRFGIVPYCALPLCDKNGLPSLSDIYVGPNADPKLAQGTVRKLCECLTANPKMPVKLSETPFRG